MYNIKFGTDGWRAIIAKEYTVDNVRRIADATARWMTSNGHTSAVVGYDCRFGGKMFSEHTACIFAAHGLKVYVSEKFVSTPMVSLAVLKQNADMGIVITASHNPPSYNGYKLKSSYGGPTIPAHIIEVESHIEDICSTETKSFREYVDQGLIQFIDMETMYIDHVYDNFDMDILKPFGKYLAYDAMYGAGQDAMRRLFPDARLLHCENNPSFNGQAPEPIARNLKELSTTIANDDSLKLGIANDGDADRIGMYDADGNFVDSHHILLLLLMYLKEHKNFDGKVVVTFSVTDKMKKLAEMYGFDFEVTKIGFKYIAEIMTKEEIIVGGEESGGLAIKGHIPERDGIWIGLTIMEFMAKTGKSFQELVEDLYSKVGAFKCDRDDLHIDNDKKWAIMDKCKNGEITKIGARDVVNTENVDGYKFYLSDGGWVMIRPSGTEPVLRVYAQGEDNDHTRAILDDTHKELG